MITPIPPCEKPQSFLSFSRIRTSPWNGSVEKDPPVRYNSADRIPSYTPASWCRLINTCKIIFGMICTCVIPSDFKIIQPGSFSLLFLVPFLPVPDTFPDILPRKSHPRYCPEQKSHRSPDPYGLKNRSMILLKILRISFFLSQHHTPLPVHTDSYRIWIPCDSTVLPLLSRRYV